MKRFIKQIFIFACPFLFTFLISCSDDEQQLDLEQELIETADLTTTTRSSTPCTYKLSEVKANTDLKISCLVDLEGQSVDIAPGATLDFDGGDIINGTLNFKGGQIDGNLLNKSLKIKGDVTLKEPEFQFDPSRWDIVQGPVSSDRALKNRDNFEDLLEYAKSLGADTFVMGAFDAYFEVGIQTLMDNPNFYSVEEGINIPSDFTLQMSDDTHLRVEPNSSPDYALIAIFEESNSKVFGGVLHGDRDEHNYTDGSSHEWGHLIQIRGSKNVEINGVTMRDAAGDGMKVESLRFSFEPDYVASENINIRNCTFDSNRRNNLSITGGEGMIVENNAFYRAGVDTDKSQGTNPRFQIDIEAHRKSDGEDLIQYEIVDGVIIRNNLERDTGRGGFLVSIGKNVTIENNDVQSGIAYNYGVGTTIRNNILNARNPGRGTAIKGGTGDTERISDNKIYGNKIYNYQNAITIYSQGHEVYDNTIMDCGTGLLGKNLKDSKIYNNSIISQEDGSRGIYLHATYADNVEFTKNRIETKSNPLKLSFFNNGSQYDDYKVTFRENEIFSPFNKTQITFTQNVEFIDNDIVTGNDIRNCKNLLFENNKVDGSQTGKHTFEFRGECANIKLFYNHLIAPRGQSGTHEHSSLTPGAIIEKGNRFEYK